MLNVIAQWWSGRQLAKVQKEIEWFATQSAIERGCAEDLAFISVVRSKPTANLAGHEVERLCKLANLSVLLRREKYDI